MPEIAYCAVCNDPFEWQDEPNVCMLCGRPLCPRCYDESPYCANCEDSVPPYTRADAESDLANADYYDEVARRAEQEKSETHYGECEACDRVAILNGIDLCEGCMMQIAIDLGA